MGDFHRAAWRTAALVNTAALATAYGISIWHAICTVAIIFVGAYFGWKGD